MIHFRPLPGPTIATAIMLPILIGLGVWQMQRLHWKEDLLATLDRNMHRAPLALDRPGRVAEEWQTEYLHVVLRGHLLNTKESYLFASDIAGNPGYHVVTPLETVDHRVYLIDRGYVSEAKREPRAHSQPKDLVVITGFWRWGKEPGRFTPASDLARRVFYVRDADAIAGNDGIRLAQPAIIDADGTPNSGGWPIGGQTIIDIPNNHLSYALTWFGLAIVLSGIYVSYHIGQGRLRLKS